jgi:long-chain acyl-CoA synthetase
VRYLDYTPTRTLPQLVDDRAAAEPDETALCQWVDGEAQPVTWAEYRHAVSELAVGLAQLGVRPGERVAVMSGSRKEFAFSVLAVQSIGGIALGVYPTNSPAEVRQFLSHSDAVAFIGEDAMHLGKVASIATDLPALRLVVGIADEPPPLPDHITRLTLAELRAEGARQAAVEPGAYARLLDNTSLDDPAVLFYTSGSTGAPKGVTHSHRSLQHGAQTVWGYYPDMDRERHDVVAFLPVAFVAPAIVAVVTPLITRMVVTFCPADEHMDAFRKVRPTAMLWVPRLYEKFAGLALEHLQSWNPVRKRLYEAAMVVGRRMAHCRWDGRTPSLPLRLAYQAALRSVFLPLRKEVGLDRMTVAWTASAAMPESVMTLWQIWGLDLRETYGLTETGGSVTGQFERPFPRPGNIGAVFPDRRWALQRAEDGELLVRAPLLFQGYWKDPERTAEVLQDGWLKTGDLVEFDAEGRVHLVGRKKDVIITSGGKTISPQPIEVSLKESPLISEAVVVGDARKYLTVLLELDVEAVGRELGAHRTDDQVSGRIALEIERVNKNLARAEQLKQFRILPRPLAIETGERTANGKMKRAGVVTSFAALIDDMYGTTEAGAISRQIGAMP